MCSRHKNDKSVHNQGMVKTSKGSGYSPPQGRSAHPENLISSAGKPIEMRTVRLMTTLTDSVCRIDTGSHTGTGYMVRIPIGNYGDLYGMLTNHHVIGRKELGMMGKWNLEFEEMGLNYDWSSSDWCYVFTDPNLDCTFVVPQPHTVDDMDAKGVDFMPIGAERVGMRMSVIQHPQGGEMSFSYGKIVRIDNYDMYHNADTMGGSSGSPLINDKGEVVGLHKAWEQYSNLNLATRISTVVDAIKNDFCSNPSFGIARKGGPIVNRDPRTGKAVTKDPALALRMTRRDPSPSDSSHDIGPAAPPPPPKGGGLGFDLGSMMGDLDKQFRKMYVDYKDYKKGGQRGHSPSYPSPSSSSSGVSHGGGHLQYPAGGNRLHSDGPAPRRGIAPLRFPGAFFGFESYENAEGGGPQAGGPQPSYPNQNPGMPMPMPQPDHSYSDATSGGYPPYPGNQRPPGYPPQPNYNGGNAESMFYGPNSTQEAYRPGQPQPQPHIGFQY